jgi:hypothetical protein
MESKLIFHLLQVWKMRCFPKTYRRYTDVARIEGNKLKLHHRLIFALRDTIVEGNIRDMYDNLS